MDNLKVKEPFLAVMLSVVFSGLGQIYSGRILRGIVLFLAVSLPIIPLTMYLVNPNTVINIFIFFFAVAILVILNIWIIFDAYFCARAYNLSKNLERKISGGKRALFIAGIVIVFLFNPAQIIARSAAMYIKNNIVQAYKFPSDSMAPTIQKGDFLLADKAIYKKIPPKRGDLVVFRYPADPKKEFVKRLIAVGGENVEIKSGRIYINGEPCADPRIDSRHYFNRGDYGQAGKPVTVPDGYCYVLGDNSSQSMDSRYWGFIPDKNVFGKIYKIYWPLNRSGKLD